MVDASGGRSSPTSPSAAAPWSSWSRPRRADRRDACSTPPAAWSAPASSICTPTCASPAARRPRRWRAGPGPPPSVATPPSWPCRTRSPPSTRPAWPPTCWPSGAGARPRWPSPAPSPSGGPGAALAPIGELAALGVRSSPTTVPGVQDGALMRRALDYAKGLGVTLAQHCEDACLAGGGAMHEGCWSSRLGLPGHARGGRGVDGGPGHPAGAPDRRARCTSSISRRRARCSWSARPRRRASGHGRGGAPPHAAHPCRRGRLRPGLQGQPAPAHRRRRRGGHRGPVRRHHRRHRHRPCAARPRDQGRPVRPGASRHARAADGAARRLGGALAPARSGADLRPA